MRKGFARVAGIVALFAGLSLSISGCSANLFGSSANVEFSSTDIMFAQMMVPHHQQAVDMDALAQERASSPEVKELAAQIGDAQRKEIKQMNAWLKAAGASAMGHHDMEMRGMLTHEQFAELETVTGAEFDRMYLEYMIEHHRGAIDMAQMITGSRNNEARKLGENIVSSQTDQIAYMESLLAK